MNFRTQELLWSSLVRRMTVGIRAGTLRLGQ